MEFIWHCSKQPKIEKQPKNLLRGDRYIFASRTMGLFMPSKKNEGSLMQGYGKICKICYIVSHYLFWWKDDKEENWVFGKPGSRGFLAFFFLLRNRGNHRKASLTSAETGSTVNWRSQMPPSGYTTTFIPTSCFPQLFRANDPAPQWF